MQRQMVPGDRLTAVDPINALGRSIVPLPEFRPDGIAAEVDRIGLDHPALVQQLEEAPAFQHDNAIHEARFLRL